MDITSANSTFHLTIATVFPISQSLQGYATDDAFTTDAVDPAEVRMGVDGKMSAGFTPFPTHINIAFQPDSPSIAVFDAWLQYMKSTKAIYTASGVISVPSIGKLYILKNGVLTKAEQLPGAKKILEPQHYTITFESVIAAPQ